MSTLSEATSKQWLARYGIPVVPHVLCADPDEAVEAAASFGHPVVAKLNGDGIAHKTERGLVRLGLEDADAVRSAATELLAAARTADGTVGVLVAPMLRVARELIAGISLDPQFGLCVMVGAGGVLAEAVGDVAFRLVPIEAVDVDEMVDDLRCQSLLGEQRGEPPVDRRALGAVLMGLSDMAEAEPDLVAADINPLATVDGNPVALDALVEIR